MGATGQATTQAVIDLIAMGICKDEVIDNYVMSMAEGAGPDERHAAARQIADLALGSDDPGIVARALKALKSLLPLDPGVENALDRKLLALINRGEAERNVGLAEAIALFVYCRSKARVNVARPYIPALLSFLGHDVSTTGAYSYYTLMIAASEAPQYFEPYVDELVLTLNSPGPAAKAFAIRIIATLAPLRPEYAADARDLLYNLSETGQPGMIRSEAASAYQVIRNLPMARHSSDISLYEKQVWQRAVGSHVMTAYGEVARADDRAYGRRPGTRRRVRPSKRCDLYKEFTEKLKAEEQKPSFEDQIALLSPETIALTASCEITPVETAAPLPAAAMSQPATDEPVVVAPPAAETSSDQAAAVNIQEMLNEVQIEFSSKADGLLDALGMGHLKRGGDAKAEDGNRKINAKEFVSAVEKLVREHKSKAT